MTAPAAPATGLTARARAAVSDAALQESLGNLTFILRLLADQSRKDPRVRERRELAARVRRETIPDLPRWIDRAGAKLEELGVTVHHAPTRDDAARIVTDIARREGVDLVVKGKSMATEEIHLNAALEAAGVEVVETDLGEYIVQLAGEPPSHIVGPALHKRLPEIAELFSQVAGRQLPEDPEALCAFARYELRDKFLRSGMGVTGANFLAADTGTITLVTNEGNGRMCSSMPRIHVAVVPVEKIVPRLADVPALTQALVSAASGQTLTTYVSMITGPRQAGEVDGPEEVHVVFLDHGRLNLVGTKYEEMLACVRCGACLNACPVYGKIGGHAYASVYSGPMGAILTPLLSGGTEGRDLPEASSLCGACTEACPVDIPLADFLVHLRADLRRPPAPGWPAEPSPDTRRGLRRVGFEAWARLWSGPSGYRLSTAAARVGARTIGRVKRAGEWLAGAPFVRGWTSTRDLPVPARRPFRELWRARQTDSRAFDP